MGTRSEPARRAAQILVGLAVAVVVLAVARFVGGRQGLCRTNGLFPVFTAYRDARSHALADAGSARLSQGESFVHAAVAVVVLEVTQLGHGPEERVADARLRVLALRYLVVAGTQPAVDRAEPFVDEAVAVVVHRIADFRGLGMDLGIQRLAVQRIGASVIVVIVVDAVLEPVQIRVGEALVDAAGAVVVLTVADFGGRMMDQRGIRGAVHRVRVVVPIVVRVAGIAGTVLVEVRLGGVRCSGAVVRIVELPVTVLVVIA